ncbi:MAG: GldG family protein [Odoribacter sp.]|nr:GldG family protein [Odoribacter sp.]
MKKTVKNTIYILIAVFLLNATSYFVFFRWDFTANKRYSLGKVSKTIIRNNNEPVVVDFYVTKDLPQNMKKLANEFHFLLKEYKSLSNTDVTINTIHPATPEKELKATKAGIDVFFQEIREKDLEKIQRIFMGAVFHIGKKQVVIPRISFDTPLEYRLTSLFKQMSDTLKPIIGLVRGHQESSLAHMPQFINELSHLTEIQFVDLNQKQSFERYNVMCIIDPKDNFSAYELEQLEKYLDKGGRLFIALNHAIGQLGDRNNGFINPTGIEDLLEKKGLKIKYDFIVDNSCGTIAINQQYGFLNFQSKISFPYVPIITNFSRHTITQGLKSLLLPFASSIEQTKTSSAYIFTPLAKTSSISGTQQAPVFFDFQKQWTPNDFNHPHSTVAALLTNEDNNSSIVTITDADFISDYIVSSSSTDNIKFAVNSIEWLADNSGLIQLRNKFTTFSFLEPVSDPTKAFLKYLNFLLPPLLIISGAFIHYRIRQRKRINRSRPGSLD